MSQEFCCDVAYMDLLVLSLAKVCIFTHFHFNGIGVCGSCCDPAMCFVFGGAGAERERKEEKRVCMYVHVVKICGLVEFASMTQNWQFFVGLLVLRLRNEQEQSIHAVYCGKDVFNWLWQIVFKCSLLCWTTS